MNEKFISGELEKKLIKTTQIGIKGNIVIPYCSMKKINCFDSAYWNKCSNFIMYILEDKK